MKLNWKWSWISLIKIQLTLGRGKLMDFNKYVFIMARCCNTIRSYLRPQEFQWGVMAPRTNPTIPDTIAPSGVGWRPIQPCEVVVPGMYGAHYEHDTLISHQFSITNLRLLLCGWNVNWDARAHTKHPSRTSPNNNNKHTTDSCVRPGPCTNFCILV